MNPTKIIQREKQLSNPDLRDTVQVFCRLRPLQDECELSSIKLLSSTTITISSEIKTKSARKECNYVFRHVFTSYSVQREVFEHVALPLLEDVINGKNGLLFTYGVTGSGKTYTLTGDKSSPGIMPTCINTLFNSIDTVQCQKYLIKSDRMNGFEVQSKNEALEEIFLETKSNARRVCSVKRAPYVNDGTKLTTVNENCLYAVFVSYTEIYNNTVYDLLDESNNKFLQVKVIREDSQKNMYVNGVEEVEVKSAADAFELFALGQRRKRMAHTLLNAESSRSHSIFNIKVVQLIQSKETIPSHNLLRVGQLSLVDLAGSERCNRTKSTGIRLKEAGSINNSLMTLRVCMETLRENQSCGTNRVVPYRDSRLTLLFKNYFESEGQVRMIVCINPSEQDCEENLQVMKFAEMTQDVQITKSEPRYLHQFKTPNVKAGFIQTPRTTKMKTVSSFLFGPKILSIKLEADDYIKSNTELDRLLQALQMRRQKAILNKREFVDKEKEFRKQLIALDQKNVVSEIRNLKAMLKKQKILLQNLNVKVANLETLNHTFSTKNNELRECIQTLQLTIDEKNLQINQNCLENEKTKQKFALQSEKFNRELDDQLRNQRHQFETEMQSCDLKLRKMKEIMEGDVTTQISQTRSEIPLKSSEEEVKENYNPQIMYETSHEKGVVNRCVNRGRFMAGEVWLEHNCVKPVALSTVMQPSMKKRKSVDRLKKAADVTNPKQNKYCLIAQEADKTGDVETKLYKGDIVPTCGGGAQVIFNGIECLREESSTNK